MVDYPGLIKATPNLISYWRLGESAGTVAADSQGSNHGTYTGGVTLAQTGAVYGNLAASFDGVNDAVSAPADLSATNVATSECWLWWNAYAAGTDLAFEYATHQNLGGFFLTPDQSSGVIQIAFGAGGATKLDNRYSRTEMPAAQWNHVVLVVDKTQSGAARIKFYVNGFLLTPTSSPTNVADTTNFANSSLYLMSRAGTSLFGAGKLDEVALYTRALTAQEILEHYWEGIASGRVDVIEPDYEASEPPIWTYQLAQSVDLANIGEVTNAKNPSLALIHNRAGSLGFSLNIEDDLGPLIEPISTCVIAERDGVAKWSGPVWTVNDSGPEDTIQVNCVGWLEELQRRLNKLKLAYAAGSTAWDGSVHAAEWDATEIAFDLLRRADQEWPLHIELGSIETTQPRIRTYEINAVIGQEIQALSDIESGYDIALDPLTRVLDLRAYIGSARDVHFGYATGPENLASCTRQTDGSVLVNRQVVTGKFATWQADDDESKAQYGLFEDHQALSDVADQLILKAFAGAELTYKSRPRQTFQITPKPSDEESVPVPFDDFDLGDTVTFSADRGRLQIEDQAVRIFGMTITPDDNGVERLSSLQVTASG